MRDLAKKIGKNFQWNLSRNGSSHCSSHSKTNFSSFSALSYKLRCFWRLRWAEGKLEWKRNGIKCGWDLRGNLSGDWWCGPLEVVDVEIRQSVLWKSLKKSLRCLASFLGNYIEGSLRFSLENLMNFRIFKICKKNLQRVKRKSKHFLRIERENDKNAH